MGQPGGCTYRTVTLSSPGGSNPRAMVLHKAMDQNFMADRPYPEKLRQILEDLRFFTEPTDMHEYLIDLADRFQEVPERIAKRPFAEEHRVPFCESQAFVWAEQQPDRTLKFYFAVENPQGISAKALSVILDESLSGLPPEEIVKVPTDIVLEIFGRNISMGKGQGLMGIVNMVKSLAQKFISDK
ncbi:MAG: hypothetical protein D6814_01215 [Calditrichaeota bacterium]|nr:MAG: hypothetical protein D6814_01215 [Calditrichota bacterium]